jgi:hypothetical protein
MPAPRHKEGQAHTGAENFAAPLSFCKEGMFVNQKYPLTTNNSRRNLRLPWRKGNCQQRGEACAVRPSCLKQELQKGHHWLSDSLKLSSLKGKSWQSVLMVQVHNQRCGRAHKQHTPGGPCLTSTLHCCGLTLAGMLSLCVGGPALSTLQACPQPTSHRGAPPAALTMSPDDQSLCHL